MTRGAPTRPAHLTSPSPGSPPSARVPGPPRPSYRRRAGGQAHRVGHRHEHFARSLEALPGVRGADVVHKHQVASLPALACGVLLIHLIDQLYDMRADRVAVA